ncbi:cytosine/adenosine deaminase-related metal-dependent hydrolase [Crenobacter luteus]|uniref:8-oxoguanine deaminase n=1 Tax=Crenobacter luteus TaxID=1452487 RepID=UPI00104815A7|nr:8-oxoguanine deaminase [Crenobacter luteus]TCP15709.1 cytosine/adenosine deaminase-related metal-dependent hydrolase [Crenobacter luteus]
MPRTLIKHIHTLVTMDDARRELADAALLLQDNRIVRVGTSAELADEPADEIVDLTDHLVLPGFVNTHHHMYQSLTRVVPAAQDCELFDWLKALYPIWAGLTPEMIRVSTQTAMAELILSGCTTASDHLYIYPNGCQLDDAIEAATEIGMRFHASRGAMSLGESKGGLPPDAVVENEDDILRDARRLIETYHDAGRYAMTRVVVAPCSPFSVTTDLMREAAHLARAYGVSLHTHLAENYKDIDFSREVFGMTPTEYVEDLGWVGHDVWHAHCVQLDKDGIDLFARTGTGVAHCPCSNMRLASGIAPIRGMLDAGVKVGIGVDGSASNDGGHMLNEVRQAMLLQRVGRIDPAALSAREAIEMATRGGAAVLNRDDIGQLAPGFAADFIAFDLNELDFAGGWHDPVAALLFCASTKVNWSFINGRAVVRDGELTTVPLRNLVKHHNLLARQLVNGEAR